MSVERTASLGLPLGFADVRLAHERLQTFARYRRTPLLRCSTLETSLESLVGRRVELFFKAEHLQATGSFKIRGALNALLSLSDEQRALGVVTHSSGNHGQGLALAAQLCRVSARVVVPRTAPPTKVSAIRGYGAEVIWCEPTLADREASVARIAAQTGATFVPPFNSEPVMAGQGTVALEMCEDAGPEGLDAIVIPISGGGLIGGCAIAAHGFSDGRTLVFGAEPSGADDAWQSKRAGSIVTHSYPATSTICDALRINAVGDKCWPIIRDLVEDVVVVSDGQCIESMRTIYCRMKQVIEPSGAVATAALFTPAGVEALRARPAVKRVGVLLCGGNLDLDEALPWAPSMSDDFSRVCRAFRSCFDEVAECVAWTEGGVYSKQVVAGLSDQSAALFGAALVTPDGRRFEVGSVDVVFQLQSTFKLLTYGLALEEFGPARVSELVGSTVCLSSHASVEAALLPDGRPMNPFINAGALRMCAELGTRFSEEELISRLLTIVPGSSRNDALLAPEPESLRETRAQQSHNLEICRALGLDEESAQRACGLYAAMDCMRGTCCTLSSLGAKLAAGEVFSPAICRQIRVVALGCGMYEASPSWALSTGLPSKSGVSGVVVGAGDGGRALGPFGVCVFAPPLDERGNSVRAQSMLAKFCDRLVEL